ncbi:MAG: hypothetical protein HOI49_02430 [Bacteroidetes bacterium]|nr:hypothetical protein [Bacteroidota bacterium]
MTNQYFRITNSNQQTYLLLLSLLFISSFAIGQNATQYGPDGYVIVEEESGGFEAELDAGDRFGRDHDVAGDVDGDGVLDIIVGARSDDDGATDAGAFYILFMNADGTVKGNQKVSSIQGKAATPYLPTGATETKHLRVTLYPLNNVCSSLLRRKLRKSPTTIMMEDVYA